MKKIAIISFKPEKSFLRKLFFAFVVVVLAVSFIGAEKMRIREPYVAGKFYEGNQSKLSSYIDILFEEAVSQKGGKPKGLIVPHAGYPYSGQIAADGFNQAKGFNYDFVVVLGTNHTASPQECGFLYDGDGFKTPLGVAYIDTKINEELSKRGALFKFNNDAHTREHSIEVQVPFIQKLFPKAKIVPIVIAATSLESVKKIGTALSEVLKDKNFLIVASSDLSHYPDFDVANIVDKDTLRAVATMEVETIYNTAKKGELKAGVDTSACGISPIMTLVQVMNELSSRRVSVVSYANSGQSAIGETDRVVGYGAVAFYAVSYTHL
ncbi:MAG: AmmeMemoRadiSam system protein B, partial [Acidobacteria bacterium]|nr:AmmeMemoRadiSam system protein B [Acidobacteriota bacterium]